MAVEQFENSYFTSLNGAIDNDDTTIAVNAAPDTMTGNFRIRIDDEIILVGSVSGNNFTGCTRAMEGTSAASHLSGAHVRHVLTIGALSARVPQSNLGASAAPTATDDVSLGYAVGSIWVDTTNDESYICVDATDGAAIWNSFNAAGGEAADFEQAVLDLSPHSYWPCQDTSGTSIAQAVSPGSGSGTLSGSGATLGDSDGPWEGQVSVLTTGSAEWTTGRSMSSSDFSHMAIFKTTATGSRGFMGARNSPGIGIELGIGASAVFGGNGRPHYFWDASSLDQGITANNAYNNDVWHILICTVDGTASSSYTGATWRMYVDGQLVAYTYDQFNATNAPQTTGTYRLASWGQNNALYSGRMAHLAMWDRALTQQEAEDLGNLFVSLRDATTARTPVLYADSTELHASGDDFESTTLAGWTLGGGLTTGDVTRITTEVYDSSCLDVVFGAGGDYMYKALPYSDNFEIVLTHHGVVDIRRAMGLMLVDNNGDGVCATIYDNDNGFVLWDIDNYALTGGDQVGGAIFTPFPGGAWATSNQPIVTKLRKVGTTITAYYSEDGGSNFLSEGYTRSTTYTRFGIAAVNAGGGSGSSRLRLGRINIIDLS